LDPRAEFDTLLRTAAPHAQPARGHYTTCMRIIHTADIHLDRSFADLSLPPAQGSACRGHLFATLQAILNRAAAWPASATVISGDLFEHERVTRATIKRLREAFAGIAPIPVVLCPGRHDPCVAGSPYLTEQWPDNVHIFTTFAWTPFPVEGAPLTIHGFAWTAPDHDGTLPPPVAIPEDGRVHVAFGYGLAGDVLHGAPLEAARFGTPPALPSGLAFLGLGELHATRAVENHGGVPVWYAGAPEGHAFAARGPHHYLEIGIAGADAVPDVTPATASEGRFLSITLDCSEFESGQDLIDAFRGALGGRGKEQYVRLALEGRMPRPIYDEMDGIRDVLEDEVYCLQWHDACQVAEDYDAIAREHTSLGAFVARIGAEIHDTPTHTLRRQRQYSRDLGLCAFRGTELPIRGLAGVRR